MTRKERAITNLKQMCSDGRYLGSGSYIPLEVLEDFSTIIKALEKESVLDKMRAEIETKYGHSSICEYESDYGGKWYEVGDIADILYIIDEYKYKTEDKND